MKKRRTWRWVSRDSKNSYVNVWETVEKPTWDFNVFVGGAWTDLCASRFKALFGFVPRPGQVIKVEFSAKVVK